MSENNTLWFNAESEEEAGKAVLSNLHTLVTRQDHRLVNSTRFRALYEGKAPTTSDSIRNAISKLPENRLRMNICRSVVDTLASKIAKNKPKAAFLTSGGSYANHKKAQKLEKYVDGIFYQCDFYALAQRVFLKAEIEGTSGVKICTDNERVWFEEADTREIFVDDLDAYYGNPITLYQRKLVHRSKLKAMFEEHADAIDSATAISDGQHLYARTIETTDMSEMIEVVESWHLGETKLHIIAIQGACLLREEWLLDCFPFVFFRYSEAMQGFFGIGLVEQLLPIQREINEILQKIQKIFHLMAVPRIFVNEGSNIVIAHLNNEVGSVVKFSGEPPIFHNGGDVVNPALTMHLADLIQKAYELAGVSMLSATSRKPAGLESGVALREYNYIESDRFALVAQMYENFVVNSAKLLVKYSAMLYTEDKIDIRVNTVNGKFVRSINWSDCNLDEQSFVIQTFPVSKLPHDPPGRLQMVQELIASGFIDQANGRRLLDLPDLDAQNELDFAQYEVIESASEKILENGIYTSPYPYWNIPYAVNYTKALIMKCQTEYTDIDDERIKLLERFLAESIEILKLSTPSAPQSGEEGQAQEPPQ